MFRGWMAETAVLPGTFDYIAGQDGAVCGDSLDVYVKVHFQLDYFATNFMAKLIGLHFLI